MSLVPKKRKDRDKVEDVELLKLVGAVLDSAQQKSKRRLSLAQRITWVRTAMERQVQRHPLIMFGILLCFLILAFYIGVTSTLERQRQANAEASRRARRTPSGASEHSGPYAVTRPRTRTPSSSGSTVGAGGNARFVNSDLGRRDLARELIDRVIAGEYERRSDVATGRFLRDFENQWLLLSDVDRSQLQPARRAKKWLQVRGPYTPSEAHLKQDADLTGGSKKWREAREAIIRVVDEEEVWKLEHIRVY